VSTVVVLGAGPLGAATADQLTRADVAQRVVLVDEVSSVAQGLALDIRQSGPVNGSTTVAEGTSDLAAVVGASAVVLADRHGKGEWHGDEGLARLAAVRTLSPRALVVCAGVAQADLVEALVRERGADRRWIVGSAPEALRSGATALVALEAGTSPRDVSLAVVGRPPALFVSWEGSSVRGSRTIDALSPPAIARLDKQIARAWPPRPLTLAAAAAAVVCHHLMRLPSGVCLFLVPPAERGPVVSGVAVPATLDSQGVRPVWPSLSPRDRVRLESLVPGGNLL
jgi:hypothetical protein